MATRILTDTGENLDAISLIIQGTGGNQAPVISNSGGAVDFIENGTPVVIDSSINVADADSADFDGGVVSVDISAGGSFGDRLSIWNQGTGIGQIGSQLAATSPTTSAPARS